MIARVVARELHVSEVEIMQRRDRVGRRRIIAAIALLALFFPQPGETQNRVMSFCLIDRIVESRARRVTGDVNTECGDECRPILGCHDAPWGNWGIQSGFGGRTNKDQFAGWRMVGRQRQWNSCTSKYNSQDDFNDGPGRQKAEPDSTETVHVMRIRNPEGYLGQETCAAILPQEVADITLQLDVYELDGLDFDNKVTTLDYSGIDVKITCTDSWNCSGVSDWYSAVSTDGTGVSAEIRIRLTASRIEQSIW